MISAEFTVPGRPHGKGRPRATVVNGHARLYTPDTTAAYEAAVREAGSPHFFLRSRRGFQRLVKLGPVALHLAEFVVDDQHRR